MNKQTGELLELDRRYGTRHYGAADEETPFIVGANADGLSVFDSEGRVYIDMAAGYSSDNGGHNNIACQDAFSAVKMGVVPNIIRTPELVLFRKVLCDILGYEKAIPMNTGAEAFDTALKLCRKWGYTERKKRVPHGQAEIAYCKGGFHGRTIAAISASSDMRNSDSFGPLLPNFVEVVYGDAVDFLRVVETHQNLVAFIIEPMQGEGGIRIPSPSYLAAVNAICKRHGIILVTDEIQVGLGRTGKLLASHWSGVVPDMVLLAKSLGAGIIPVSAVVGWAEYVDVFDEGEHGGTYSGNPHAMAVAIALLQQMVADNWCGRSLELGEYFLAKLRALESPLIIEVRGKGLFIGVTVNTRRVAVKEVWKRLLRGGILTVKAQNDTIRLTPPLITTTQSLDRTLPKIARALGAKGYV